MLYHITSTKDLIALYPHLNAKSKFRTSVEQLFANGEVAFDLAVADPFMSWKSKGGFRYKVRINNGVTNQLLCRMNRIWTERGITPEKLAANPTKYRNIEIDIAGVTTVHKAECEDISIINWVEIARALGKMFAYKLVEQVKCDKCNGTGFLPHYAHVANGLCFGCMGVGKWFEAKVNPKSKTFAQQFCDQYVHNEFFPKDLPAVKLYAYSSIGHPTAEGQVLRDDNYFWVGQPICRASKYWRVPIAQFEEFVRHFNKISKHTTLRTPVANIF